MSDPVVPTYEMLLHFAGWIGFEEQWYYVGSGLAATISVLGQFTQYQRLVKLQDSTSVQVLSLNEENGRNWVGWLQKIGEGEPQHQPETMDYRGQTYVLGARGSGMHSDRTGEASYSFLRYRSQVDKSFILVEDLGGWWRHCIGREVEPRELIVGSG